MTLGYTYICNHIISEVSGFCDLYSLKITEDIVNGLQKVNILGSV